jgi:ribosomal-protein-alanine acetyltransferase
VTRIRPATPGDLDAIGRIQAAAPEASQWSPAGYLAYECRVAVESGRVAGFIVVREVAGAEWEILNLAVDPAARRRGVAGLLLHDALAGRRGAFFLEVRQSNAAARAFYARHGFETIATRPEYYSDPVEPAIVMKHRS